MGRRRKAPSRPSGAVVPEDRELFRRAVADAVPLPDPGRTARAPAPKPLVPRQTRRDQRAVLEESLTGPAFADLLVDSGWEDSSFARSGVSRNVLRRLRQGHFAVQGELDLHGCTSDEALAALMEFLAEAVKRGRRCLRVIHGKGLGSENRQPVLKGKVRSWLVHRPEVLAYCEPRPADGGGGAVLVLLASGAAKAAQG